MNIVKPSVEIISPVDMARAISTIVTAARTCYKSKGDNAEKDCDLIRRIIKREHYSVLEHHSVSVRFIVDRGVSHELVRHRLMAISQESTRYCNYSKGGISLVHPDALTDEQRWRRERLYSTIEELYNKELEEGLQPQTARGILPNALKTELVVTANIREWRHIFKLRTAQAAHPQMREVMSSLLDQMKERPPLFFEDISNEQS